MELQNYYLVLIFCVAIPEFGLNIFVEGIKNVTLFACCDQKTSCSKDYLPWMQLNVTDSEDSSLSLRPVSFNLKIKRSNCDEQPRKVYLDLADPANIAVVRTKTDEFDYFEIESDGTIHLNDSTYLPTNYCINKVNDTISVIEICCTRKRPCFRKCCRVEEAITFKGQNVTCTKVKGEWDMPLYSEPGKPLPPARKKEIEQKFITGFADCITQPRILSTAMKNLHYNINPFIVRETGEIQYLDLKTQKWRSKHSAVDYCIDRLSFETKVDNHTCPGENDVLLICPGFVSDIRSCNHGKLYSVLYSVCFVIAMLFLLATVVVKFSLWDKQNIHSWTILFYVMSLFLLYLCLTIINLRQSYFTWFCVSVGVMTHFFALCTFCWLSVVNFDLWWTFRILKPVSQKKLDIKRFMWYCSFAVLIPVFIISTALGLHFSKPKEKDDKETNFQCRNGPVKTMKYNTQYPEYGYEKCFLSNSALFAYLYGPLGFLLLTNLLFYTTTTFRMFQLYKSTRRASETSSAKQRQSCRLFLKLFVVAGLTWSFEFLYWFASGDKCTWYWVLLDMANIFQAIAIFVILVCKKETLRSLEQKYPRCKGVLGRVSSLTRSPTYTDKSTDHSTKISRQEYSKTSFSETLDRHESIELT